MKRLFLNITLALAGLAMLASCNNEDMLAPAAGDVPQGYMKIKVNADIPQMQSVDVRAVDPDGEDIQSILLFCFNPYGLFITTVQATALNKIDNTHGTFEAVVPEETKIVHFLANQNPALYDNRDFLNKTEQMVLADMEGASGMLIYWGRFEASSNGTTFKNELEALPNGVKMIRNQAKISIANWNTPYFTVTGFVTTNIHAYGTVAPLHPDEGFVFPGTTPYVTLPKNQTMMSDIQEVNTKSEDYIFEHKNSMDNPVSVIIRGVPAGSTDEQYYRVAIIDANGEQLPIRRNHSYVMNISGVPTNGVATFEKALSAPFTNNVWISIDNWVNKIEDDTYILSVAKTGVVLEADKAGSDYELTYTIEKKNGSALTDADIANVSWLDGNNVANHEFVHTFNAATGVGTIRISLNPMYNELQKGVLLIKKGRLQRTIEVNVIKKQMFTPSWVGTQIYGGETGEHVTLKFNIPETCPDILYPFSVLITVNSLDVRATSGQKLPLIKKGEDAWFGADYAGHDYKYEFVVKKPGVHRIYFYNILTHENGDTESLWLEAKYFETLQKDFIFASHNRAITLSNLNYFNGAGTSYAQDEMVYYKLVPKKRNAHVVFDVVLTENGNPVNANTNDEFLLYSKTLDYYPDGTEPDGVVKECDYFAVSEDYWKTSTSGRMMMFMPKDVNYGAVGQYTMHLRTMTPNSDDVVRIASNQSASLSAHPDKAGQNYAGLSYRSIIFELATYRPFRFAARVNGLGEHTMGQVEEEISNIELTYEPQQQIDITFDVTSFMGSDGVCVDPFGEEFDIYIDAPMLQIDESRLAECRLTADKFYAHPTIPGRFVYKVAATRDAERTFGVEAAMVADETGINQDGERKKLPFITNKVTTAGNITLSSDESLVVFYQKTFKVSNKTIDGTLQYRTDGSTILDVPQDAFVVFARTKDGVRIGSIQVTANGQYSLNLRNEYSFNWNADEIELYYTDANGIVYTKTITNLATLYNSPNLVLEKAE